MLRAQIGVCSQLFSAIVKIQTPACKRFIQRTPPSLVLSHSVRSKKNLIKTAHEEKIESFPTSYGFTEAGITIPTVDTPSMEVDGVRFDELPIVHIKSSPNNTIIICTDHKGTQNFTRSSCGQEGFTNVRKSTTVAAQATGLSVGRSVIKKGIKNVRVVVKGIGVGRLPSIKGLQMAGLNIVSLTDRTPLIHSGPRPRKARRL